MKLEFVLAGQCLRQQLVVQAERVRLSDLVPLARRIASKIACLTIADRARKTQPVACRKGCSACCRYLIPLAGPEAALLAGEINALPTYRRKRVMQAFKKARRRISATWRASDRPADAKGISRWYAGLDMPCPLLAGELCSLYSFRPIACREHLVASPAEACEPSAGAKCEPVPPPVSVLEALAELSAQLEASETEAVMLPFALKWAEENAVRSARRYPAVELIERFADVLQSRADRQRLVANPAA